MGKMGFFNRQQHTSHSKVQETAAGDAKGPDYGQNGVAAAER